MLHIHRIKYKLHESTVGDPKHAASSVILLYKNKDSKKR